MDDEQEFGPPASDKELRTLEGHRGRALPPSYRAFLTLHDGWRMAGGAVDLVPVRDLLDGPRAGAIRKWKEEAQTHGDAVAVRSLVVGVSAVTATRWLLDPEVVDEHGEWLFVEHHHGAEGSHTSFLAWLEESVDQYRCLAANPHDLDEDDE